MLEIKDLKIGMKVKIPKTKSYDNKDWPLTNCGAMNNLPLGQDYLYIVSIFTDIIKLCIINNNNDRKASSFYIQDIQLYDEVAEVAEVVEQFPIY